MSLPADWNWAVVTSNPEFLDLESEWDQLFQANPCHSPFQSWAWVASWLEHLAGPHELRLITGRNEAGALQLILPMIARDTGGLGSSKFVSMVGAYGADCSDHIACLRLPAYDQSAAEITASALERFFDRQCRIELRNLDGLNDYPQKQASILRDSGRVIRLDKDAVCPVLELPESWDNFLAGLSSNFRSQVRRHYNRIIKDDDLRFRSVDLSGSISFAQELVELNRTRMQTKGKDSSLESEEFRKFIYEVIPRLSSKDQAWMDVIEQGDRIVGTALNLVHGRTAYFYMGGFHESATRIRPGTALFAHVIKRCIDNGYTKYDFLRGAESYKYRWGARDQLTYRLDVYPAGLVRGRLPWAIDGIERNLRTAVRRHLRRSAS
jgi:CelD/BcsL family acetyltransferase involved in cellulose biosynthesis